VGQDQSRFACEPLQLRNCVRFHKLSSWRAATLSLIAAPPP
jgi:hypothetical protein